MYIKRRHHRKNVEILNSFRFISFHEDNNPSKDEHISLRENLIYKKTLNSLNNFKSSDSDTMDQNILKE